MRDIFPNSILLESSDYHGGENSYSFVCMQSIANFKVEKGYIAETYPATESSKIKIENNKDVIKKLEDFVESFATDKTANPIVNGLFGYSSYDAVQYMEDLKLAHTPKEEYYIPEINYHFYKYIIAINHFNNELDIIENLTDGEESNISYIIDLLSYKNFAQYHFKSNKEELSNINDEQYMQMVSKGKESCRRGDVFQIVLSRQFMQKYTGDEFNVYRSLRSINPSPYLFLFRLRELQDIWLFT